jgi:hypothetical protein
LVLSLQSISPASGKVGDTITIYGNNFDPIVLNNKVRFYYNYSYYTADVVEVSKTALKVIVPSFASNYYDNYADIVVSIGDQTLTLNNVFVILPSVSGFSPASGTFALI